MATRTKEEIIQGSALVAGTLGMFWQSSNQLHYFDTYALVARNKFFKMFLLVAVNFSLSVSWFGVETAFFYSEIEAPVYVAQVHGFEEPGRENWVWCLKKPLYGTTQAPQHWRKHLVGTPELLGLSSSPLDNSIFYDKDRSVFVHMHVDDGFVVG